MQAKHIRVGVLAALLLVTIAWAIRTTRRGPLRADWELGVRIGVVVLVSDGLSAEAVEAAAAQLRAAGDWTRAEAIAHGRSGSPAPFTLDVAAVAADGLSIPDLPPADLGLVGRVKATWRFWRFRRAADRLARDVVDASDIQVYVVLDPPAGHTAPAAFEGVAQQGQRWGFVRGNADAPFEIAAAVLHESLHCVGATDKYDKHGRPTAEAVLRGPGERAEVMAGEVAGHPGRVPRRFGELAIGPVTASEIGWSPTAP